MNITKHSGASLMARIIKILEDYHELQKMNSERRDEMCQVMSEASRKGGEMLVKYIKAQRRPSDQSRKSPTFPSAVLKQQRKIPTLSDVRALPPSRLDDWLLFYDIMNRVQHEATHDQKVQVLSDFIVKQPRASNKRKCKEEEVVIQAKKPRRSPRLSVGSHEEQSDSSIAVA
ncbi:hypothetical protein IAR55_000205 [Kwoniella newhampshirensis]|uniref:Uncharacterized protein n=1 Tax=Kwoniella newhampshirensis TaxID=1651941 RepID=A0AAW0Z5Z0_9TREE